MLDSHVSSFERKLPMTALQKVLYTAKAHTTGGRDGASRSDDGLLDVKLSPPKAMGGAGTATNPEQLFAAGYSACFMGAMKHVAGMKKIAVPQDASIDAEVASARFPQALALPPA
jgi:lipoyl-dependent peroxiredoxin